MNADALDRALRRGHIRVSNDGAVMMRPLRFHRVVAAHHGIPQHVSRWHSS